MAGAATEGADARGEGDAAASGEDPGEAESGLKGFKAIFRSLTTRNYRLFAFGQVVSNTGTWMQRVAQDWLVLELTRNSAMALGITTALQFLPLLLFGLWGGVLADRFDKRRLLQITQAFMGVLALTLGVLVLTGAAQVWHVYVLAFGLGMATVVDNPTRQSFVVDMVGPRDLPNAIALNSAIFNLARVLGPAIAGGLIALLSTGPVFLVNAASYVAVLIGLYLMDPAKLHTASRPARTKGALREGLRYVGKRRDLVLLLALVGCVGAFGMNFSMTTALMSKEVFGTDAGSFGLASSMLAVGAMSGALISARRTSKPRLKLLMLASLGFGVLEAVSGLMPTYWTFLALLVPTGLSLMLFNTAANATFQLSVDPAVRGRVMGLYMLVFAGTTPLGSPIIGWMAETFGARASLVGGGLLSTAAVLTVTLLMARTQGVRLRPAWRPYPRLRVLPTAPAD